MAQRKIGFFSLYSKNEDGEWEITDTLVSILNYICKQTRKVRKKDISNDRFCFLDKFIYNEEYGIIKLMFKSARHSYRAPLLNRNTGESRENPKTKEEGEQVKTHLLIKFKDGDVFVFLETGHGILSLKTITEYLNTFIKLYNDNHKKEYIDGYIGFYMIPRDNFYEVLESMKRVVCADIYIDKCVLGSDALNFTNRTEQVQQEIVFGIKPKKGQCIKDAIYDFLSKMTGSHKEIKRIRVKGKLEDSGESIIDTGFIVKKEYVDVEQSEDTGEFNTHDMFTKLENLANRCI